MPKTVSPPALSPEFRVVVVSLRETTKITLAVPADVPAETVRQLVEDRWNGFSFDTFKQLPHSSGMAAILGDDLVERNALIENSPMDAEVITALAHVQPSRARKFWKIVVEQTPSVPEAAHG